MGIENIMYFALGALAAALIALIILPAVWKRAVRLTKRRIEAATPVTMAEFRADKDHLRAEFALSTRRLEMTVETLRARLAEQLGDVNQTRSDIGLLRAERDQHLEIVRALESREAELKVQLLELEQQSADLAERLNVRERGDADIAAEAAETEIDGQPLSGDYQQDIRRLVVALNQERERASFLEDQASSLLSRLEAADQQSSEANAAIAEMRQAMAEHGDQKLASTENLVSAEARIASAEKRLNMLLAATTAPVEAGTPIGEQLLADQLSLEDQVEPVRTKVLGVEASILADWDSDRIDEAQLRQRLDDIAASVSRLVYAVESEKPAQLEEESLFDRVQRFADDGLKLDTMPASPPPPQPANSPGRVSDRMAALREIRGR